MPADFAAVHNIRANGASDRIDVLHGGLSSGGLSIRMHYDFSNSGASTSNNGRASTDTLDSRGVVIQTFRLAELMDFFAVNPNRVKFIKINCEGSEYDVVPYLPPDLMAMLDATPVGLDFHGAPAWIG